MRTGRDHRHEFRARTDVHEAIEAYRQRGGNVSQLVEEALRGILIRGRSAKAEALRQEVAELQERRLRMDMDIRQREAELETIERAEEQERERQRAKDTAVARVRELQENSGITRSDLVRLCRLNGWDMDWFQEAGILGNARD